jgi:hypothetical protein
MEDFKLFCSENNSENNFDLSGSENDFDLFGKDNPKKEQENDDIDSKDFLSNIIRESLSLEESDKFFSDSSKKKEFSVQDYSENKKDLEIKNQNFLIHFIKSKIFISSSFGLLIFFIVLLIFKKNLFKN